MLGSKKKVPAEVADRIKRSLQQAEDRIPAWRVSINFARGNQYCFVNGDGKFAEQATETKANGGGKPRWRIRMTRNLIFPILEGKKSLATQRIPGYECISSSTDPEDISSAHLAEKVALAGYHKWGIRRSTSEAIHWALTPGEGFGMAYWDKSIGPYVEHKGKQVGIGDVRVKVYGAPEVSWEPGCQFEDSPYYVIRNAQPIDSVMRTPGYLGGKLTSDADRIDWRDDKTDPSKMVMVTEYLERPTIDHPNGRRMWEANGRKIYEDEDYPLKDEKGRAVDQPCLRRLSYVDDPTQDRDDGLVPQLIDLQRGFNDAHNKAAEWKNIALNPKILAPYGAFEEDARPSDEPGSIDYYNPNGDHKPEYMEVPDIPQELFQMGDTYRDLIGFISSANDIPSQVESGKGIQALLERDRINWNDFIVKLAEWHAAIMRDCLVLVQRHYTEPRLIEFRGRTGWETIKDFQGADLRNQTDIQVNPASLEPRSKQAVEQQVMNYAQLGWISPEVAMSAINSGNAEKLVETYELDVARAGLVIRKIREGSFFNEPPRPLFPGEDAPIDPEWEPDPQNPDAEPATLNEVPGWMPRPMIDNITVHKAIFSDWMKTDDWDRGLDDDKKEASMAYYAALLDIETREAQRAAELQAEQAEKAGMENAAKPAQPKPMASLPALPT